MANSTYRFEFSVTTGHPYDLLKLLGASDPGIFERVTLSDIKKIAMAQTIISVEGAANNVLDKVADELGEQWSKAWREIEDEEEWVNA